jgi:hypothetical protein
MQLAVKIADRLFALGHLAAFTAAVAGAP